LSDPDIERAGDDFYLIASSFNRSPGLPVLHSKDLVNWSLISYVVDRLPYESYDRPRHAEGIWAPGIRYHDGKFWVFVSTPDEGIFMSTAVVSYSTDNINFSGIGSGFKAQYSFWAGAGVGMFCLNMGGARSKGYADIDRVHFE
jgi:beta-xylosidase